MEYRDVSSHSLSDEPDDGEVIEKLAGDGGGEHRSVARHAARVLVLQRSSNATRMGCGWGCGGGSVWECLVGTLEVVRCAAGIQLGGRGSCVLVVRVALRGIHKLHFGYGDWRTSSEQRQPERGIRCARRCVARLAAHDNFMNSTYFRTLQYIRIRNILILYEYLS